jgi:hypothetical protein
MTEPIKTPSDGGFLGEASVRDYAAIEAMVALLQRGDPKLDVETTARLAYDMGQAMADEKARRDAAL